MAYCGPKGIPLSEFLAWGEDDQDAALQWQSHESHRCGQCGTHPDEWGGDRFAFLPEPSRCRGCELVESKRDEVDQQTRGTRQRGLHIRLRRRERGVVRG
jgi:hypothetical protein